MDVDWEQILRDEGLGVIAPLPGTFWYNDALAARQVLGDVVLSDCDNAAQERAREQILAICARLPSRWATIMEMRSQGLSPAEIGERMGCCAGVIRILLSKLRRLVPVLVETREVSREEVEDWVVRTPVDRCYGRNRADLVEAYFKTWNMWDATELLGLPQCNGPHGVKRPARSLPDHPVSKLILFIASHTYCDRKLPGPKRPRQGQAGQGNGQND